VRVGARTRGAIETWKVPLHLVRVAREVSDTFWPRRKRFAEILKGCPAAWEAISAASTCRLAARKAFSSERVTVPPASSPLMDVFSAPSACASVATVRRRPCRRPLWSASTSLGESWKEQRRSRVTNWAAAQETPFRAEKEACSKEISIER
jgi:hypothetical protein